MINPPKWPKVDQVYVTLTFVISFTKVVPLGRNADIILLPCIYLSFPLLKSTFDHSSIVKARIEYECNLVSRFVSLKDPKIFQYTRSLSGQGK